jgi:hypothetical protein
VACWLGRAPSTISREIRRNGGSQGYRANQADALAWDRARRLKECKLVRNRELARVVASKLQLLGARTDCRLARALIRGQQGLSGVARDDLPEPLYTGPRCAKEGVAGATVDKMRMTLSLGVMRN